MGGCGYLRTTDWLAITSKPPFQFMWFSITRPIALDVNSSAPYLAKAHAKSRQFLRVKTKLSAEMVKQIETPGRLGKAFHETNSLTGPEYLEPLFLETGRLEPTTTTLRQLANTRLIGQASTGLAPDVLGRRENCKLEDRSSRVMILKLQLS